MPPRGQFSSAVDRTHQLSVPEAGTHQRNNLPAGVRASPRPELLRKPLGTRCNALC